MRAHQILNFTLFGAVRLTGASDSRHELVYSSVETGVLCSYITTILPYSPRTDSPPVVFLHCLQVEPDLPGRSAPDYEPD